ncbi:MAG: hypothetical protein P8166_04405 [Candidatus Thiodiazotropha sp.]
MEIVELPRNRAVKAKRAFTTRRVPVRDMRTLVYGNLKPAPGNLVLATVHLLGKHRRIEKLNGRRALMMPGDEIIVCYGNRYAPDQFEAVIGEDLGLCDLVAGGGIASREINRHDRMLPPTQIMPVGLIGNADGQPLNIANYRIDFQEAEKTMPVILVLGTAMNSGKTFTAGSIVRGLKENRFRVAGIKATGTGSGGDLWKMRDMGADITLDFTDAGFSSTYKSPIEEIEEGMFSLINYAAKRSCNFAVVEIADGLHHEETATLIRSEKLRSRASGVVFAAYDSMGARSGHELLVDLDYKVLAISGQATRSPLAIREIAGVCQCPVYTPFEIQAGSLVPTLTGETDSSTIKLINDNVCKKTSNQGHYVVDFESQQNDLLQIRGQEDSNGFEFLDDFGISA